MKFKCEAIRSMIFTDQNPEIMVPTSEDQRRQQQLQCQDLLELNDQLVSQDNNNSLNHMNDYAILPAVNLCPITWGIGNLEIVEAGQSGFIEVSNDNHRNVFFIETK